MTLNLSNLVLKINTNIKTQDILDITPPESNKADILNDHDIECENIDETEDHNDDESENQVDSKDTKKNKKESSHKFNYEIKESMFSESDLELHPKKTVFIQFSKITNDNLIKYFIIKYKLMEYKCSGYACPVKNSLWRRKPIYLILERKNGDNADLRISNLQFWCPNCYCQDKGNIAFEKSVDKIITKCKNCYKPIDAKYRSQWCYKCKMQIQKQTNNTLISDIIESTVFNSTSNTIVKQMEKNTLTQLLSDSNEVLGDVSTVKKKRYVPNHNSHHTSVNVTHSSELNTVVNDELLKSLNKIIETD